MSIDNQISQIEHLERLVSSKSLRIEELEQRLIYRDIQINSLKEELAAQIVRSESLQKDMDCIDDFYDEFLKQRSIKLNREVM